MKKFIYVFIACLTSFCACSNEDITFNGEINGELTTKSDVNQNFMDFASIEELQNTVTELILGGEKAQKEWCANKQFISQQMLYEQAISELEAMDEITDLEEYKTKYKEYREKYSEYFLFADYDAAKLDDDTKEFDLSPYLPSSKESYALVCNPYGKVKIGNEILDINDLKSVYKTDFYASIPLQTRASHKHDAIETAVNYLYIRDGNKKMWAKGRTEGNRVVYIKYIAHKKGVFGAGWHKYKTKYTTKLIDYNPSTWSTLSEPFKEIIKAGSTGVTTPEMPSDTQIQIGTRASKAIASFKISSRGTGGKSGILQLNI